MRQLVDEPGPLHPLAPHTRGVELGLDRCIEAAR
jgi:hypothetical protein